MQFQEKVRNTCYGFVHNKDDADDLSQEVFIQVYKSYTSFREESEMSTWIYRIAVNKSLDFLRKKKRKKRFAKILPLDGNSDTNEVISLPAESDPQTEFEDHERKQILKQAVDNLPDKQKAVITLSKYEGFRNKEIADVLHISLSSVEALMYRAKKNLHKKLYNYYRKSQ